MFVNLLRFVIGECFSQKKLKLLCSIVHILMESVNEATLALDVDGLGMNGSNLL